MLETGPVTPDSAFYPIVHATEWTNENTLPSLRVAPDLGWLLVADARGSVTGIIGFSAENNDDRGVLPPHNLSEVERRWPEVKIGLFNTDMTAKGLGSVLANTPYALDPPNARGREIQARQVPFTEPYVHPSTLKDSRASQIRRMGRHLVLLGIATAWDKLSDSLQGSYRAMQYMERSYGSASLVHLPAPPIWQKRQRDEGTPQPVAPQIMLVRGGSFAHRNTMTRIGTFAATNQSR